MARFKILKIIIFGVFCYACTMIYINAIQTFNLSFKSFDYKKQNDFNLSDILITLKSSSKYHKTRLKYILQTWYQQAKSQVDFCFNYYF